MKTNESCVPVALAVMLAMIVGTVILSPLPLKAQSFYGSIVGTVTDTTGAIVPGAVVTITDVATNEKHSAQSDSAGDYQFVNLVPAVYKVEVEKASFKRYVHDQVQVEVNTTTRVNAPLQLGEVSQTVEVNTDTTLLQTDSGTLSTKVEGQQVQEMPLNGRNIMNLLELVPGVIPTPPTNQYVPESQTGLNSGNGTNPAGYNGFQTNGGNNMEYLDGAPLNVLGANLTLVPTQDAIQEFSADTNSNGADQGRVTGGAINMTSRTGTNQYHGSVYEYFRNRDLNANPYFNNLNNVGRPEWNQNQYGVNIGLPIKKDKIFFFGSWEGFDLKTAIATSTNMPTGAMQAGIFTRQITDPLAPGDGCVITHDPVAATWTLGQGCLDPTAQVMKTFFPLPTNPSSTSANYYVNSPDGDHQNQMNARLDFNLSPKQRIFIHEVWWHVQDLPFNDLPTNTQWTFGEQYGTQNNNTAILGDTYTISPKSVLDVRLSYLRFLFGSTSLPRNVNYTQFGPAWATLGGFVPAGNDWIPEPNVSGGVHSLAGGMGIFNFEGMSSHWDTYGVNGSLTHVAGRHSIKIGGEARLMDAESAVSAFSTGNTTFGINFSGVQSQGTGDEWAEFLMGYPKSGTFGGSYPNTIYSYYQAYYVQDTWQATRNLTLNLGLRYELPGGLAEKKNSFAVLLPYTLDPYTSVQGTEALTASPLYKPRTLTSVRHDLVAPRVGFAYRVDNKTVVRGGFGVTYQGVDLDSSYSSVVNSASSAFSNTTSPVIHLDNPFPAGVVEPTHRSNPAFIEGLMQNSTASGGYGLSGVYPYIPYPYIEQWNFTVSRSFGNSFQTSISYVGTHGVHLKAGGGIDQIPASNYQIINGEGFTTGSNPVSLTAKYNGTGTFCTPGNLICNSNWTVGQSLQPYPYYKSVSISNLTYGNSNYNALQVQSQKRFKGVGEIGSAFTWAKTIGDNSGTQDYYNHQADRSVSGVPMRLVVNYVLPLPFGEGQRWGHFNGVADKLVSGWAFNGITSFQHGSYIGITESSASLLSKDFGAGTTRSNYVPSATGCNSQKTMPGSPVARLSKWFNTACFAYPGDYSFGNENVNDPNLFGQGVDLWDIAMLKSTKLTEKAALQFRVETFNIFNHPQFGSPSGSRGSSNFGKVTTQQNNPRLLQLSARVNF